MIFFKYTKYLEQQVIELKAQNAQMQGKNDQLVDILVSLLDKSPKKLPMTAKDIVEAKKPQSHKIEVKGETAHCTCGWTEYSNDPATLQESISKHYRETHSIPVRGGRGTSWVHLRAKLENLSEKETS